jgi:hypothetical protein
MKMLISSVKMLIFALEIPANTPKMLADRLKMPVDLIEGAVFVYQNPTRKKLTRMDRMKRRQKVECRAMNEKIIQG